MRPHGRESAKGQCWVIVLAGGEGDRMRALVRGWLGQHRPKQYCNFIGRRSMLEHTLTRAATVIPSSRILTVIGKGHRTFLQQLPPLPGRVIEQPERRDTVAGILLPLTYVLASDPDATVLLFPSDHFVFPESEFTRTAQRAAGFAERFPTRLILLGAIPDAPENDYGWVETGPFLDKGSELAQVTRFYEKPSPAEAKGYYREGLLWNTLVIAAKAAALWSLAEDLLPHIARRFNAFRRFLELASRGLSLPGAEKKALGELYEDMGSANFSRDILQQAPRHALLLPLRDVQWSDWGRPARVLETCRLLGKQAAFAAAAAGETQLWPR